MSNVLYINDYFIDPAAYVFDGLIETIEEIKATKEKLESLYKKEDSIRKNLIGYGQKEIVSGNYYMLLHDNEIIISKKGD